jgi:DNA repair exonuclease SbcCD ATPase subunit
MSEKENEFLNQQKTQGEEFNAKDAKKLEQIQQLGKQIEQLKQSVTDKEAQLSQLTKKMADAIQAKQTEIDELRENSGGVNGELLKLQDENKMLIKKIIDSTNIIVNALNALEEIRKRNNPENLADIDAKIAETNAIIDEISGILTNDSTQTNDNLPPPPGQGGPSTPRKGGPLTPGQGGPLEPFHTGVQEYKKKRRGGFFANYDVDKNRKSRKSSTRNSSSYSKSKKSKKTRKQKKRRSSRSSFRF